MDGTLVASVQKLEAGDQHFGSFLTEAGLVDVFESAQSEIARSHELHQAVATAANVSSTNHREAIARSILATAVLMCLSESKSPAFFSDFELRAKLVRTLAAALGPAEGMVPPWLMEPFLAIRRGTDRALRVGQDAASAVVSAVRNAADQVIAAGETVAASAGKTAGEAAIEYLISPRAGQIVDYSYETFGDILLYQAKGRAIRQAISNQVRSIIEKGCGPVVLLGHSLGGIASFEMLVEHLRLPVADRPWAISDLPLLITVGSQAPFLFEINALQTFEVPFEAGRGNADALPVGFPAWLNLYDPRDLLSFVASPVFPGARIFDQDIHSGQPFPHSHGAYWTNQATWAAIKRHIESL